MHHPVDVHAVRAFIQDYVRNNATKVEAEVLETLEMGLVQLPVTEDGFFIFPHMSLFIVVDNGIRGTNVTPVKVRLMGWKNAITVELPNGDDEVIAFGMGNEKKKLYANDPYPNIFPQAGVNLKE
jgi:hypothetical protein